MHLVLNITNYKGRKKYVLCLSDKKKMVANIFRNFFDNLLQLIKKRNKKTFHCHFKITMLLLKNEIYLLCFCRATALISEFLMNSKIFPDLISKFLRKCLLNVAHLIRTNAGTRWLITMKPFLPFLKWEGKICCKFLFRKKKSKRNN